jgi:nucleotide-binding universal stress UspA family protein
MSFKDLLVVVDTSPAGKHRLEVAAGLATRFEAHLVGVWVMLVIYPLGAPMAMEGPLLAEAAAEARSRAVTEAEAAHQIFDGITKRQGVSAEWRTIEDGAWDDSVALHARYADLTIIGQIEPGNKAAWAPRPEAIAMASGRPVLVIPYVGRFDNPGRRVLVGWNASREATRAVNDALPLLQAADIVTILVIDPQGGISGHGAQPGADIALHLARHGVKATVEQTGSAGLDPGDVLLSRAADLGADLIVAGAYGHTRLREWVLGGATRTLLGQMTAPVLMAH